MGVAVFVDFPNLYLSLRYRYIKGPSHRELARLINEKAEEYGDVMYRACYGNWNDRRLAGLSLKYRREGYRVRNVVPKVDGSDKTDVVICIDAVEIAFADDDVDTFVIVSGDSDYVELAEKLTDLKNDVYCISIKNSISPDLYHYVNEVIVLEEEIVGADYELVEIEPIIDLLHGLEKFYADRGEGFVAVRHFMSKLEEKCPSVNAQEVVNRLGELEVVSFDQIPNPKNSQHPTTVIELNREHDITSQVLDNAG